MAQPTPGPLSIPPELAQRLVRIINDRHTLTVLARTSRTLQSAAERRLYENIDAVHHPTAYSICRTLARCQRVAAYVRTFILSQPARSRDRERDAQLQLLARQVCESAEYWAAVRRAIRNFGESLEYLHLTDPTFANSWVLAPTSTLPQLRGNGASGARERIARIDPSSRVPAGAEMSLIKLRALEMRLYLPWDENIASFLGTQDRLRMLCISDVAENVPVAPLSPHALPALTHFEGPIILLDQLLHCPITHLKLPIDSEDAISLLPLVLPDLAHFKKLRSLSVVGIPQEMTVTSVDTISRACLRLKYLSVIPWPIEQKPRLRALQHLIRLHDLTILELDVSYWSPAPTGAPQRAIAIELRMVLPELRAVVFWIRHERFLWMWSPEDAPVNIAADSAGERETMMTQLDDSAGGGGDGDGDEGAGAAMEEGQHYVGMEGWKLSWSQSYWMTHSSTWKTSV